ncbi:type II restriction/modification system DNA methylase subunit YeeA [Nitrosomonas ureae]|uniref:class I SAM-dependent DNA methyltransferase n=1 Tax=Nitrosomonas ureae TaxID=44577 RepID=UPI000D753DF1|nr:DNA methyltransferase [Nitrosomonas ureae]PXX16097.1 type II restriction/modification system DNA methylase subunit YeeA [Nitrosomonas ureae]
MNAVEIEEAISRLAEQQFDPAEFPYAFLEAFGNKATTISRLRSGNSNKTDIEGAVLQQNNIHIKVCATGEVLKTLEVLKNSPATSRQKAKFVLATDGEEFQAENMISGETVACAYRDFPDHFGFFLSLAGITTVQQISENAFDIRATSRLNRLYVELLKDNPDWGTADRRPDMNHFMARLIFCFFAEDTDIFNGIGLFTDTIEQMSAKDSSNTHEVISEIFRAMNTKIADRTMAKLPRWADTFPYVNGGLFSGSTETPRFSKIARSYLLHVGKLDWKKINPDIFGSMIQAVAEDEERGALGMHYTSVPNILKVLNPLFLDELRAKLEEAEDNPRTLLNLRKRLARIRVFDPACGSGNFLVIAYKEMRAIEAEINKRRGETGLRTEIPLTNFRGIELRDFPAEIARLALIIAEYQCDVLYRGPKLALAEFLPLDTQNWITCGNALRLDWLSICPPTGTGVKLYSDDLLNTPLEQAQIDFENEGGETYICGNPPYKGSQSQDNAQKVDLEAVFEGTSVNWKGLDYVGGWFQKAANYCRVAPASFAFVSTNSICQGKAVSALWPYILRNDHEINFAYTSFKWANLASHNAGVIVVIIGVSPRNASKKRLFVTMVNNSIETRDVKYINAYLVSGPEIYVEPRNENLSSLNLMAFGNMPIDGGFLSFNKDEIESAGISKNFQKHFIRKIYGAAEYIRGQNRYCFWIGDNDPAIATEEPIIKIRLDQVQKFRSASKRPATRELAGEPHRFGWVAQSGNEVVTILPRILSERREYITVGHEPAGTLTTDQAYALYDAPLWNMAIIASRLHIVWIATVCGKLKTDFRYSNTLGWNTFPVPQLTEKNKADLTRCAEDILLAREAHFPATIADLYDPDNMPENLRHAHERNDEVLERIYIGRRFKNDTERLEKLFEFYTKMTGEQKTGNSGKSKTTKS